MKCKICKSKEADKKNSHLVPKFLGKGLFGLPGKIRGYKISSTNPTGKAKIVQDIPKEDYIFCSDCESKLSTLENYFAKNLYNHLFKTSNIYKVKTYLKSRVKFTDKIDGNLINLLLQSILWRQHISNHQAFVDFKIDKGDAKMIRRQLNSIIAMREADMITNMNSYRPNFKFFTYLMWTHTKLSKEDNFLVAIPDQSEKYLLVLNSLRLHMCSSSTCFKKERKGLNTDDKKVSILVVGKKEWRKDSYKIFKLLMGKSYT